MPVRGNDRLTKPRPGSPLKSAGPNNRSRRRISDDRSPQHRPATALVTASTVWGLVGVAAWTTAIVLALHWWTQIRAHDDDIEFVPIHLCQWVTCRQEATNQVQVHHPAGNIRLCVCDKHLRSACRAQAQTASEVYEQALDELENFANGETP